MGVAAGWQSVKTLTPAWTVAELTESVAAAARERPATPMTASAMAADLRRVEAMRVSFVSGAGWVTRGGVVTGGAGCPVLASRGGGQLGSGQRTVWGKARAQIGRRAGFTRW